MLFRMFSADETKLQEKPESSTAGFGYRFKYLYWNTIIITSTILPLLAPTGNSIRMALHSTAIINKMSLIYHLDLTAYKTGGGNGLRS